MKGPTPGAYAVQFIVDAPGRLDFHVRDASSLDDALGFAREAAVTHPDFEWNGILIWKDHTAADLKRMSEEMEQQQNQR